MYTQKELEYSQKGLERLKKLCFDPKIVEYISEEDREAFFQAMKIIPIEKYRRMGARPTERGTLKRNKDLLGRLTVTTWSGYPEYLLAEDINAVIDLDEEYKVLKILLKNVGEESSYVKAAGRIAEIYVKDIKEGVKQPPKKIPQETTENA